MGNKSEGDNTSNKKLIILLSVLAGIIAVLVITILVVHNMLRTTKQLTTEQWEEGYEMESTAMDDCEDISSAFSSGMITKEEAEQYYKEMYDGSDSSFYKVRLTLCYTDNMYNKNKDLNEAVTRLSVIEPLIENTDDYIDYYDRLIVYYVEADDWDKVYHYAELRDALLPLSEIAGDELMEEDEANIEEEEQIINNDGEIEDE